MLHYTCQFANALAQKCTVSLILTQKLYEAYPNYFDPSIRIKTVNPPHKVISQRAITEIPRFLNKLADTRPDVVHFTGLYPWTATFVFLLRHYNFFLTLHDPIPHKGEKGFIRRFNTFMFKRYAHHFFVHGQAIKKTLLNEGFKDEQITVIPHGNYHFLTKYAHKNVVAKEPVVLFFGRISDYKGIEYLLQAEPLITQGVKDARIIIAGEGDFTKYNKYLRDNKQIEVINRYIRDEEIAGLFQQASVVVLPYVEASQTGIIPIAYSFKKPVIVSNVGSLPEVVDDEETGFIVPPRDSKELARAIIKLLKNPKLGKKMGEMAYEKMEQTMNWDEICDIVIGAYKNSASSRLA